VSEVAVRAAVHLSGDKPGLEFKVASAQDLPFESNRFDKIIVNELIEHVPDADRTLAEISRVAKPGALVYLTSPKAFDEMLPIFRPYCKKVDLIEGHLRRYSLRALQTAVNIAGFDVCRVRHEGFFGAFLWYGAVIYNAPVKKAAMKLVTKSARAIGDSALERPRFNALSILPFSAIYLAKGFDALFAGYRGTMGMHVLLRKREPVCQ